MSLREQAERDLSLTLEDTNGAGEAFELIDLDGNEFTVTGVVGDIGVLYTAEGEVIRNRNIRCACRISSLASQTQAVPERGWRGRIIALDGVPVELFVTGCDPDRTVGVYHLVMGINLEEAA